MPGHLATIDNKIDSNVGQSVIIMGLLVANFTKVTILSG